MIQIKRFCRSISSKKCTDRHMYISKDQESNLRSLISIGYIIYIHSLFRINRTIPSFYQSLENIDRLTFLRIKKVTLEVQSQ